jgi:hypothetical protein
MKKLIACFIACCLVLPLGMAYASPEAPGIDFDMADAYITGVDFTYPVVDLGDDAQSETINGMIETDALAPFASWEEGKTAEGGLVAIWQEGDILSLAYDVLAMTPGAAHPQRLYYTAVYDVKQAVRLNLNDLADVKKIAAFLSQRGNLQPGLDAAEEAVFTAQADYVAGLGADAIESMLLNEGYQYGQDPSLSQSFSFLGEGDELMIVLSVPYALGDWAVFALPMAEVGK